jgi:hypothetical protein
MLGVDDGGDDGTTESGTNLVELVFVVLVNEIALSILHLHVERANLQLGAVGCQTRVECGRHTGTKVATDDGGTEETNLWLLLLEEVHDSGCVWERSVGEEFLIVEDVHLIYTVGDNLLLNTIETSADKYGFQLYTQLVGELATLGAKLQTHISNLVAFEFAIYKYVVHIYLD